MRRLHPITGTKERYFGRQALTFRFANHGPVIVDGVRPEDCDEIIARLWGAYGRGSVWVTYRRLKKGEQYAEMPEIVAPIISGKLPKKDTDLEVA